MKKHHYIVNYRDQILFSQCFFPSHLELYVSNPLIGFFLYFGPVTLTHGNFET